MSKSATDFRTVRVELEVRIDAAPDRVWDAMVRQTTHWWRKDFYTSERTRGFHIEPVLGGRAYEDWGDGNGLVWFNVISVDAPRSMLLVGHLTAEYGGPAQSMVQLRLGSIAGEGGNGGGGGRTATLLRLSDTIFGNISEALDQRMHEGWVLLFEQGLKRFVEDRPS